MYDRPGAKIPNPFVANLRNRSLILALCAPICKSFIDHSIRTGLFEALSILDRIEENLFDGRT